MASAYLLTAAKSSPSSPLSAVAAVPRSRSTICRAEQAPLPRRVASLSLAAGWLALGNWGGWLRWTERNANAAVLEAEDDLELLEKVKKDRKRRLERQGIIKSSDKEKGYLQYLVYKLSEVGQAIDRDDLAVAGSVLGPSTESEWVRNANAAFAKLSSSPEEKTEADTFNSALASLITSVTKKDVQSSKVAFVSSASALERWTKLTGLANELKGL
ncbi:hypothetical protein MLD38_014832 [Melastoma candidum]|uniref:Uncharacterized protein n=1 Tax=Melastoma candidum TaxID=119954 RepID=A0ACB9RMI7_9MYRT|nr:hypothetical protein MLD38_014832 [Melastoma candidum]